MEQTEQLSQAIANGDIIKSLEAYVQLKKQGYSVQIKETENKPNDSNNKEEIKKKNDIENI